MISWIYLFEVGIIFSVLYAIYWLFFRKNTFHQLNRILLILILFVSLTIPQLEFSSKNIIGFSSEYIFEFDDVQEFFNSGTIVQNQSKKANSKTNYIVLIYFTGVLVLTIRAIKQIKKIVTIYKSNTVIAHGEFTIVSTPDNIPPFSFFYWIFLPEDEINSKKMKPILDHESVHARQWHTFDLLLTELFCIFLWFVPFVYSFKNSIKSVHEFLADDEITKTKNAKIDYLTLLAHYTEKYTLIGLSNNFYCSTLKNRITMITKNKTSKLAGLNYLLIIPAVALFIQLFACNSDSIVANEDSSSIETVSEIVKQSAYISPLNQAYEISAGWGKMIDPISKKERFHKAVDLKAKSGTKVMAIADGEVIKKADKPETYGHVLVIQHANNMVSLYAHLDEYPVEIGTKVKQGAVIGTVGNTGRSTGPHLHLELIKDGERINPNDYIKL